MAEKLKIPTEVIDADWTNFQLIGGDEKGERDYKPKDAVLVKKSEVKNATTDYKERKIGKIALLSTRDKLAA